MSANDIDSQDTAEGAAVIRLHRENPGREEQPSLESRPNPPDEGMAALSRLLDEEWVF